MSYCLYGVGLPLFNTGINNNNNNNNSTNSSSSSGDQSMVLTDINKIENDNCLDQQRRKMMMHSTGSVIQTLSQTSLTTNDDHYNPTVREVNIPKLENGSCGFDLSRSKWDPYPWVSGIDLDATAHMTGLKVGDCVLEVNGEDILGLRIAEVANLVRAKSENVTLLLWTTGMDPTCSPESLCCGPMPLNLDRLSVCVQSIVAALECPVCLDTIPPPVTECINGHLVCSKCRIRAEKCPVCRQRYSTGRSLIAEQVYNSIIDSFKVRDENNTGKLRERLFGTKCRKQQTHHLPNNGANGSSMEMTKSHTHKFLAKIMGKATSLDSLSNNNKNINGNGTGINNNNTLPEDQMIKTKQLSVSVNEIYRSNSSAPVSRSTSPHRLIPDLGSQTYLGTRRPKSQNVSTESLNHQQNIDCTLLEENNIRLDIPTSSRISNNLITNSLQFCCPSGEMCTKKFTSKTLTRHIVENHKLPIITFGHQSAAEICLPPRQPIDNSCLLLTIETANGLGDQLFWLRLINCDNDYFIGCLIQSSLDSLLGGRYYLEVKISNNEREMHKIKEIVLRSTIHSLETNSWYDIFQRKDGILITNDSIRSTFDELPNNILLTASIKQF